MRNPPKVQTVDVVITTLCNLRCPDCCCRDVVFTKKSQYATVDEIAQWIEALESVPLIILSGGEPTLHPDFPAVAAIAKKVRGDKPIQLITNGARLVQHAAATAAFDLVQMSVFPGGNDDISAEFKKVKPPKVLFRPIPVKHYRTSGKHPCGRHYRTASVMAGRIFPCCVACGISQAESTTLDPGWQERLFQLRPPCGYCVFGMEQNPTNPF